MIFFLFVNEWDNLIKFFLGIIILKWLVVCFIGIICWFRWWELVVIVNKEWLDKIKCIFVKIGWFLCCEIVKIVLLISLVNMCIGNFIWLWFLIIGRWG